ncbi:MAG: XdhC family protein [Sedimentisphaerales bacterium]|nr:XdhC family protein [Sedimentisphaerales bacterium]
MIKKNENSAEVFLKTKELIDSGENFAVALILKAEGSTPRKAGARAIITHSGRIYGTIGGGAVESETQSRAVESCKSKKPDIFDFELQGSEIEGDDPICGGKMRILIDPVTSKHKVIFNELTEVIKKREKGVLLTALYRSEDLKIIYKWFAEGFSGYDLEFPDRKKINLSLKNEQVELLARKKQESVLNEVFVEPIIPRPLLVIAGGGHIGQALAVQANLVGFDTMVLDDRSEFTNPELFPNNTTTVCGNIAQELAKIPAEKDTYIVIVTRGHKDDAESLAACINRPFSYIGMIGSKRKNALICDNFIKSGLCSAEQFDKLFAPIGFNIGAVTVPEIATSITAELIAVRRKGITHKPWTDMEIL